MNWAIPIIAVILITPITILSIPFVLKTKFKHDWRGSNLFFNNQICHLLNKFSHFSKPKWRYELTERDYCSQCRFQNRIDEFKHVCFCLLVSFYILFLGPIFYTVYHGNTTTVCVCMWHTTQQISKYKYIILFWLYWYFLILIFFFLLKLFHQQKNEFTRIKN